MGVQSFPKHAFLVNFLVLAPSSHNSQPWRVTVGESEILLSPEYLRSLPESDPHHRELYVSLGCALKNLLTAADYYGMSRVVDYFPPEFSHDIRITFGNPSASARDPRHAALAIPRRSTNRAPYDEPFDDTSFCDWIKGLSSDVISIDVISDGVKKGKIADVVSNALVAAMDNPEFRHELSQYIKSNVTASPIGMTMNAFGMPTPVSLFASFILRRWNVNKKTLSQDRELLTKHTPYFVVISAREDRPLDWLHVGELYEEIALEATLRGLSTAPMTASIEIGDYYKQLQNILGTSFRPHMFFRLGRAKTASPHGPRLRAEEIIEYTA